MMDSWTRIVTGKLKGETASRDIFRGRIRRIGLFYISEY